MSLADWNLDSFAAFWQNLEYEEAMNWKQRTFYDPDPYFAECEEEQDDWAEELEEDYYGVYI